MVVKVKAKGGGSKLLLDGKPVKDALVLKKGGGKLSVKHPDGTVEEYDIEVSPPSGYIGPVAHVGCEMGATINTGNYENVKVNVSLTMPCYPDEVDTIWEYARDWCDERLTEVGQQVKEEVEK